MKKFGTAALAAGLLAAPAFAASITVSFASDDGPTQEWTFDQDTGMATMGEISAPYTWDEDARKLCVDIPEQGEVCGVFDSVAQAVGESSSYTLTDGTTGTATVTAMSE